jgi:hypothetical protein
MNNNLYLMLYYLQTVCPLKHPTDGENLGSGIRTGGGG